MTNIKLMILATMLFLSFCLVSAVAPKLPPKTPPSSPPAKTPPPSRPAKTPPPSPPPPKLVSYNLISISWPTTLCSISKCIPKSPYEKKFTMHGIWPTDSSGFSVIDCSNSHEYKEEDLPTVYWPGYTRSNSVMWEGEWKKHGRCSTFTPKDYFQKGLYIIKAKQQQIYDALSSEGVIPTVATSYIAQDVHNALVKHLGLHPQLNCKKKTPQKETTENAYLYEVRLCADLSLNLINCPKNVYTDISGCGLVKKRGPNTNQIYYPDAIIN